MLGPPGPLDFLGRRLRLARAFHGLDRAALAGRVGVLASLVDQIERGVHEPTMHTLQALATELDFDAAFLEAPLADEVGDDACHLRRTDLPPLAQAQARAHAALLAELCAWLSERVCFPDELFPEVVAGDTPEMVAAECRRIWNLKPRRPIANLTRVLERAGMVVARLPAGTGSFVRAGRRVIVVIDAAATRADLAWAAGCVFVGEEGADRFAQALLLDAPPRPIDPPEVLALALEQLAEGARIPAHRVAQRLGWTPAIFTRVTGLEISAPRDNVRSLADYRARRAAEAKRVAPAPGPAKPPEPQMELDFGPRS